MHDPSETSSFGVRGTMRSTKTRRRQTAGLPPLVVYLPQRFSVRAASLSHVSYACRAGVETLDASTSVTIFAKLVLQGGKDAILLPTAVLLPGKLSMMFTSLGENDLIMRS